MVDGSSHCPAGYVGTGCWHFWMSDADPKKWILSQHNSAGESPKLQVNDMPEQVNWVDFVTAKWPYDKKDFICAR